MATDKIDRDFTEQREILHRVAISYPAVIFVEGNVEHPMQAVVSRPEELHPRPLVELCVRLSPHTAPIRLRMKTVPCATVITLTADERSVLEALYRSTKSEARMRFRARIVLLAAGGMGTREIGRAMGLHDRHRVEVARALCPRPLGWPG
jgi:hypothetical protein